MHTFFTEKEHLGVFDTIVGACRSQGFSPRVENEQEFDADDSLVGLRQRRALAIVPASSRQSSGRKWCAVRSACGQNCISTLIVAWRLGEASAVLCTFLDFLTANATRYAKRPNLLFLPSPGRRRSFLPALQQACKLIAIRRALASMCMNLAEFPTMPSRNSHNSYSTLQFYSQL